MELMVVSISPRVLILPEATTTSSPRSVSRSQTSLVKPRRVGSQLDGDIRAVGPPIPLQLPATWGRFWLRLTDRGDGSTGDDITSLVTMS